MTTTTAQAYLIEKPNLITRGKCNPTSVDDYRDHVADFVCYAILGNRYDIRTRTFDLKANRSIRVLNAETHSYSVTPRVFEQLAEKYEYATDF